MMNTILVVTVNWLGDTIFSLPVFRALKEKYPQARVVCLALPRVCQILEHCPDVDEIIVYDEKGRHYGPLGKLCVIRELRQRRFDAAFLLHGSLTRALLAFLAGIPRRVGYDLKNRGWLLTHVVTPVDGPCHRADYYLRVIETICGPVDHPAGVLKVRPEAREYIREILDEHGISDGDKVAVINTGGNWDLKQWPVPYFARVVRRLTEEAGVKVVLPGMDKDKTRVQEVIRLSGQRPADLTGRTPLPDLVALMARADVVLSADSGPLHIAHSVGTPVVAVFGPTRPEITGPRGGLLRILQADVGCNRGPCYFLECPDNVCMQRVGADEVAEAALVFLNCPNPEERDEAH